MAESLRKRTAQLCFECHYRFEGILVQWNNLTDNEKEWWLDYADQILSLIIERGKGIENPHSVIQGWFDKEEYAKGIAFCEAIQAFTKMLEEESKVP